MHPIYHYAVVTDAVEGLILVDVDTLADGEARNNFLKRAVTWNPGGVATEALAEITREIRVPSPTGEYELIF